MNYARFINPISASRYLSPLRKLTQIQAAGGPSLIALGTGAPNANCYPFEKITVTTKDHQEYTLEGKTLNLALSYGPSPGVGELVDWLKELQVRVHKPPVPRGDDSQMDLIILPGSQDGLSKSLEMLVENGDYMLMEEPAYPGALAITGSSLLLDLVLFFYMKPYALNFLLIESDGHGMKPESLRKLLSPWTSQDARTEGKKMPKVLLVQPNHCNPSGVSLSYERRLEIYKIAQEYDLIIIEDDPYYFLTFGDKLPPPSFLSMDTDGRVLKLDSFSKVMSGGMRMGTLTGPKALVTRVLLHLASTSMQCSTLSQVLVLKLLQRWGYDGFLHHAKDVAKFYESQCQKMLKAAETHLQGLAEWHVPTGGMFLWLKVLGVEDTYKMIMEKALSKQVVLAPGNFFVVDDTKSTPYLRASFSAVTEELMNEAFKRLAELIREEQSGK